MLLKNDKEFIKNQIDEIEDKNLIAAIKNIVEFASNNQYAEKLKPLKKNEVIARAKISNRNIKQGKTKPLYQVKKESDKW
jgi:SOS-response transcriptional repressor LexA